MENLASFLPQILSAMVGGASVYAAIRADLARLHADVVWLKESSREAHARIDHILNQHQRN